MAQLQRQLSNGRWVNLDGGLEERLLAMATSFQEISRGELEGRLVRGEEVRYRADDWYPYIRIEPVPRQRGHLEMVIADCGHRIPREQVMSASFGTSCPDCYDRMSG